MALAAISGQLSFFNFNIDTSFVNSTDMVIAMAGFQLLQQLPEELLHEILERLSHHDLVCLNLASRWCYEIATPLIWREVELVDCRTYHDEGGVDEHDDTPLLKKLLILAK